MADGVLSMKMVWKEATCDACHGRGIIPVLNDKCASCNGTGKVHYAAQEVQIADCFFLKDGKCCSPEIYRIIEGMDSGKPCPFNSEDSAFMNGQLHCLEHRMKAIQ